MVSGSLFYISLRFDPGLASYIPENSEEIPWLCGTPGADREAMGDIHVAVIRAHFVRKINGSN